MSLQQTEGPYQVISARQVSNGASGGTSQSPQWCVSNTTLDWVSIMVNATATSGTSPNLTLTVQWSPDGGTTWFDADATAADAFTALTAAGKVVKRFNVKAPTFRLKEVITGTSTPTVTYDMWVYSR